MKKFIISMLAVFALVAVAPKLAHAGYQQCQPTDFTADAYTIPYGGTTNLHWDSIGCDSARIDPADYPEDRPPYDTIGTVPLYKTTYFTLTVYDAEGNIGGQRFLTVTVEDQNNNDNNNNDNNSSCHIVNFEADDTSIQEGDDTRLRWNTSGCDDVKINQGIGRVDLDGSESVSPDSDTTYTLSAYDNGKLEDTDTVRINVDQADSCSIDSFKADDYSIQSGDSVLLSWRTSGTDSVRLSPGGSYNSDDSVTVRPTRTTTYDLTANCQHGSDRSKSLTISVDENRSSLPQAVTTVATITSQVTAQLNGIAFPNTTSSSTRAWFQWGPSTAMSFVTAQQSVASGNGPDYYNASVSGIVPGTTYYYRAVVQNASGIAYGDIVPFKSVASTPSTTVVHTTQVVSGSTVVAKSAPSLLELRVQSAYDRMCVGGTIDYTVTYRNISSQTLRDAVVQINHQKEVTFIGASRGSYDVTQRSVTVPLGDVAPGETGTIILHGRVNNEAVQGTLTVLTAQVVYTNSVTKAQESAIAYSLVTVTNDCPNVLGASAFGFGNFLPNTLVGWLLLILIILALIVLGRNLYKKPRQTPPTA